MLIKDKYLIKFNYNSLILPYMVGKTYKLYNGKNFLNITVKENMLGYVLGNFVFTRKVGKIHNLTKQKGGKGVAKKK